ncbi:MAG: hypothetical protein U0570_11065 [Phycisphaerales bacterium]
MSRCILSALALSALAGVANASMVEANLGDGLVTSASGLQALSQSAFGDRGITAGDTYRAALLGQSAASAGFITNTAGRVTTFTYGNGTITTHGTLAGSNATVNIQSVQAMIAPNTMRVVVACYTTNNTNLWLSGITIGGSAMTQGRFDVGSNSLTPTNGLLWDNLPGAVSSVSIFSALWSPSNSFASPLATSAALTNQRTLPEMGSAVIWNGVVGFSGVISEIDMIFDITFVPTPGTASLLALGGLVATRRRRV